MIKIKAPLRGIPRKRKKKTRHKKLMERTARKQPYNSVPFSYKQHKRWKPRASQSGR